jgi:hypothetical protein
VDAVIKANLAVKIIPSAEAILEVQSRWQKWEEGVGLWELHYTPGK